MSYIDDKYIGLISPRLEKFKRVKGGLYNFRCPYCGDSQKHKNKARGYIYQVKADYNFKCHNCGVSRSFTYFLKDRDKSLYDQFVMERYSEGLTGKATVTPEPNFTFSKPKFKTKDICDDLDTVFALNKTHSARCYLVNRGIKEESLKQFYYCPNFKEWTNKYKKTYDSIKNDESRIIIPLRNSDGTLFGYQGRSLDPNAKMRYITIMLDEDQPKIYGLDKINETKPIYIIEGPFDSTFVENSVAMCGSDIDIRTFGWSNYIWVYDNEPRNREIVNRISKSLDRGDRVIIWPSEIKQKDINDMILAGHNVMSVLECNTYSDLEGTLKLTNWKKT